MKVDAKECSEGIRSDEDEKEEKRGNGRKAEKMINEVDKW